MQIITGDSLEKLKLFPDKSVNCIVTSPPYYGLRDYGVDNQIGLEETPEMFIEKLVRVFHECKRILTDDGTLWLNIGDSYNSASGYSTVSENSPKQQTNRGSYNGEVLRHKVANCKQKDLIGVPWLLAFALRSDGWYLRQDIIWAKPNPMPESVIDRCTKSHEYIFLLTKNSKYYFDNEAIQEDAICKNEKKNKRDVWNVATQPNKEAHFATFPEKLIEPCILAGCPKNGVVLDPFCGSGTTGIVSVRNERDFIGVELNPEYAEMSKRRIKKEQAQGIQMSFTLEV